MIERLEEVDDIETRAEIDQALLHSEEFDRMVELFEEVACDMDYAEQKYLEGETSGLHKWYRKRTDGVDVKLDCKVMLSSDELPPSFELIVKPIRDEL